MKVYKRSISPSAMLDGRRHAWRIGPNTFRVGSRDAEKRYRVEVVDGMPLCTCTAATGDHGRFQPRPCWHVGVVAKRLLRELRSPCRVCGQGPCTCRDNGIVAAFAEALLAQQVA